jgi:squalene/oxidosqualene cyclase-like protein
MDEVRLQKAADLLLSYQNRDGGFSTYESTRGFGWYEYLNPSEVFENIMIDYSYAECTTSALTALVEYRHSYPNHKSKEIAQALERGRDFLKRLQRDDGSWYGSWGCCFCYGTWFGIEGLVASGESTASPVIQRACEFLLKQQRPNGGWGEDFTSFYNKSYSSDGMKAYGDDGSAVVHTAWALLGLAAAKHSNIHAVKRGMQYLIRRQLPHGDWPQEGIVGAANGAIGMTYTSYRNVFPIWALGRCRTVYGDSLNK